MKQLEALGMVQYFLYEREDLQLAGNTAFLGPNGTGKTALLDAFQIVLLAADGNKTHFNASGEGKKRARTLREYCLGVYGQSDAERCRTSANTYINLVFRDPETDVPVTAGVSLSASVEDPDHAFNSLYILPGVALTTSDHVDKDAERETILPWRKFQHIAKDACTLAGTTPVFTQNREEFLRQLFVYNLASPGERPNIRAIRSAFARSLKLNKDVDDLDETLRQHLIEQRLTNVKAFRTRLEQFRDVREMIRRLKDRIDRAGEVADRYAQVKRERTTHANLEALRALYETERVGEELGDQREKAAELEQQLEKAVLELGRAGIEKGQAQKARDRAFELRSVDPDYLKQAGESERLKDKQTRHGDTRRELGNLLKLALDTATAAGKLPAMAQHRGDFEHAVQQLFDLQRHAESLRVPEPVALRSAMQAMADVRSLVNKALSNAERDAEKARDALRDARTAWERSQRGLTQLRQPVTALQRLLADAGIDAQPICDLVKIADPPFLGRHALARAEVSTKVVRRVNVEEKVGVYVSRNGRDAIVEYSEMGKELMEAVDDRGKILYWAGNTAIHCFHLPFLKHLSDEPLALPYHCAAKEVEAIDHRLRASKITGWKFETFVFDAIPLATRTCCVEASRQEEFSPIKNSHGPDSPETAERAMVELHKAWLRRAGIAAPDGIKVEISPLLALDEQELAVRMRGRRLVLDDDVCIE